MVARLSRPTCFARRLAAANAHSARILPTAHERITLTGPFDDFPGHFDKSEILPEADPESGFLQQLQQQDTSGGPGRILLLEPGERDREVLSKAARLLHPSIKSLIHNGLVQVSEWR